MIETIIDLINNGLDGIVANQLTLGLAQRVYRVNGDDSLDFMPGVVNAEGEALYAGIDDIQSLIIYHKTNSASLAFSPRGGYGDTRQSEDSISCALVAAWDTRKVKVSHVDMMLLLRSRFPQSIVDMPGIKSVIVSPVNALLNSKQVFDSEYSIGASNYILPIYINLIQINYSIQIRYDQTCINQCISC